MGSTDKAGCDAILKWIEEHQADRPPSDYPIVSDRVHEELMETARWSELHEFVRELMRAENTPRLTKAEFTARLAKQLPAANVDEAWAEYMTWAHGDGWVCHVETDRWHRQ